MPATLTPPSIAPPPAAPPLAPTRPVQDRLRASPRPELRRLSVVETAIEIIIIGRVPSYYLKQLALETVRTVSHGRRIVNRIVVISELP